MDNKRPDRATVLHRFVVLGLLCPALFLALSYPLFFHGLGDRDLWSSHEGARGRMRNPSSIRDAGDCRDCSTGIWSCKNLPSTTGWSRLWPGFGGASLTRWRYVFPPHLRLSEERYALFVFGMWRGRPLVGVVAAAILMTAMHYTWLARVGRIDMPLAFLIAIALGAFYLGCVRQNATQGTGALGYFLVAYAAIAAAVLLKGPIGALLPAAVAGTWLALEGRLSGPLSLRGWVRLARASSESAGDFWCSLDWQPPGMCGQPSRQTAPC